MVKIVKFAAEDSLRGASNKLKVIVPTALSLRSVETRGGRESRQRGDCTTTSVKWSDSGDLLGVKSGKRQQSQEALCRRQNSFPYAEHRSRSRRRSTNV